MKKRIGHLLNWLIIVSLLPAALVPASILAAPPAQEVSCAEEYTVQADDWLSKIADKFLGNILAYPAIVAATNRQHAADVSFAEIINPDLIEVGWKICVPTGEEAQALLAAPVTATPASTGAAVTLTVSAAADLTFAFQELGRLFEQETGNKVTFNFGSTGQLAQQIEQGAPVDLFAAANVEFVDELDQLGLILPDTRALYARGRITLWTLPDSPLKIERVEDLASPEVKLAAIANPDHAPYGIAAREALQAAGVWETVQPRLVLGENVRQTLQYAETGNVDVAIVALSLSLQGQGRWTLIPEDLHQPIDQALAVIKGTPYEAQARQFATFINGPEGRPVMRQYGFILPGEAPVARQFVGRSFP